MKIKINDALYPCTIKDTKADWRWNNRESKTLTLEMDAATAAGLFVDDEKWSVVHGEAMTDPETGETIPAAETDMSEYCVAGPILDNRDGTVTVKMGKPTADELLDVLMGG